MTLQSIFRLTAILVLSVMGLAGCEESKGPVQKAGESVDKGVQNVKDAVVPPGPAEKVGRSVDKALDKKAVRKAMKKEVAKSADDDL